VDVDHWTPRAVARRRATAAAKLFTVNFFNNGSKPGNVMLFQRYPEGNPWAVSLAWLTKYADPKTRVSIEWTDEPCFVCSSTSRLAPGIIASVSGVHRAGVVEDNVITLTDSGGFKFVGLNRGPQPGYLTINVDGTIQPGTASAGIGMAGQPRLSQRLSRTPICNLGGARKSGSPSVHTPRARC
jgi:hypothetical protein